jgi:formylglycine-generating enzyme required for sulfatase activity
VGEFLMGQTPITQAQWRVVASWEPVELPLPSSPSRYPGANRPVESVSWDEAMEFCRRLEHRTGKRFCLPSEAQWEYACRAGTSTPFHFGATLSTELANYDGNYTYADGRNGKYREQTTEVNRFPANAWGLQDMHGNVWEWCLDRWHSDYKEAPCDGSAWLDSEVSESGASKMEAEEDKLRLLRGGSWSDHPGDCRSAYRSGFHPDDRFRFVGFRLCCLPQD